MSAYPSPKTGRFQIFLATGGCLLGGILIYAMLFQVREPVLAGRRLSAWRTELEINFKGSLALDQELERAGTNALPFLVKAARATPPFHQRLYLQAWSQWVHRLPTAVRRHLYPPSQMMFPGETLRQLAFTHLAHLGVAAAPAMPALIDVLQDRDERFASCAVEVFASMGPVAKPALPALIDGHGRFSPEFTLLTLRALGNIAPRDSNVVDVLARNLKRGPRVALAAAHILRSNRLETRGVVSALTALLKSEPSLASEAATLLAEYGAGAEPAVPSLIEMLRTPNGRLRTQAAITLGKLGRTAAAAESALRDALKDDLIQVRQAAAAALKNVSRQEG